MFDEFYSSVLKNAIMPVADKVMHTRFIYYLKMIEGMNKWSKSEIDDWQNFRLQELIKHAFENTEYYRNLMDERKLKPSDIKTKEHLVKLPYLTKETILSNYSKFVPRNIASIKHMRSATGGSTGDPMKFLSDYVLWSYLTANKIHSWQQFGYSYGNKYIALGSSSLFPVNKKSFKHKVFHKITGCFPLNAMNLSDEVLNQYTSLIKKERIRYVYGYASAVYLLAKYVFDNKLNIDFIKGCFTTSEILTDEYRKTIENAFNCKVMDCYGVREGGISVFEINRGFYHVGYNSVIELDNVYNNNSGEVMATNLLNLAFPFIRFKVGDEVTLLDKNNDYPYNGQLVTQILGRTPDIIKLKNGRVLTGPGFTILFRNINVKAYKISKAGDMEINCEIQPNDKFRKEEEFLIISTLKKHAGDDCKINFKYIEDFNLEKSGKRRYFIS